MTLEQFVKKISQPLTQSPGALKIPFLMKCKLKII